MGCERGKRGEDGTDLVEETGEQVGEFERGCARGRVVEDCVRVSGAGEYAGRVDPRCRLIRLARCTVSVS